jgi:hypothetical protein
VVTPASTSEPLHPDYQPGVCNIGRSEVVSRRRIAYFGVAATVILYGVLVALQAPPVARLLVGLPAALAAGSYLESRERFCVLYGATGVYNFGSVSAPNTKIPDREAHALDVDRSRRMLTETAGIAVLVAVVAPLLPI